MFTEWNAFAKVDSTAQIILPANANFADTQTEVNYDQTSDSILGTLVYSYGGRQGWNCQCGHDWSEDHCLSVWGKIWYGK